MNIFHQATTTLKPTDLPSRRVARTRIPNVCRLAAVAPLIETARPVLGAYRTAAVLRIRHANAERQFAANYHTLRVDLSRRLTISSRTTHRDGFYGSSMLGERTAQGKEQHKQKGKVHCDAL
jgi:hypothetical protein